MAGTEAIKQVIVQAAVNTAEAVALAISPEDSRNSIHLKQIGTSETTRPRMIPSLR